MEETIEELEDLIRSCEMRIEDEEDLIKDCKEKIAKITGEE